MSRRRLALLLLALWALCLAVGLWRFATLAPTDFGFTKGMNRLEALLSWWALAAVLALPAWRAGRGAASRAGRWAARLPLLWLGSVAAGIAALLIWSQVLHMRPPPQIEPGPQTEPGARPVTAPAATPG